MKKLYLGIEVKEEVLTWLKETAKEDRRSLRSLIGLILENYYKEKKDGNTVCINIS